MNPYLIGYIALSLLLIVWILKIPHTPTSLDPEPPSVWDFPGWYILIMMLGIGGFIVNAVTS